MVLNWIEFNMVFITIMFICSITKQKIKLQWWAHFCLTSICYFDSESYFSIHSSLHIWVILIHTCIYSEQKEWRNMLHYKRPVGSYGWPLCPNSLIFPEYHQIQGQLQCNSKGSLLVPFNVIWLFMGETYMPDNSCIFYNKPRNCSKNVNYIPRIDSCPFKLLQEKTIVVWIFYTGPHLVLILWGKLWGKDAHSYSTLCLSFPFHPSASLSLCLSTPLHPSLSLRRVK